jgi:hypothetical protein
VNPRLVDAVAEGGIGCRLDLEKLPARTATRPEHRVHDREVGDSEPMQQHGDGLHQHRRVVGDDLQRRTESTRIVLGVHRNQGVPDVPALAQPVVRIYQSRRYQTADSQAVDGAGDCGVRSWGIAMRPPVRREVGPR